ncbi:MAG: LeuA family protein [Scytonema sp. PMC 1069.18]|nr:LeuA family protein [Scytonema sp. PMC 1069.18]MEC4882407.1 LeuA family protein [Scytonema sp. PMC 1070.18]
MKIFETTLRDGEQAAFIHLEPRQKADIAVSLEAMGVDIIDAGFPVASKLDWEGAYAIADATSKVQLSVLARHMPEDIKAAYSAVKHHIDRSRLTTWVMPYELYSRHALDPDIYKRIVNSSRQAVIYGREIFPTVQYYLIYSGNRDKYFLSELAGEVVDAGATCIAIADSQSTMNPDRLASLVSFIKQSLPTDIDISIHCHNNMGLALANTVAAINAGANQVEATIGGIGDAGGNTSLEQILAYASYFEKDNLLFNCRCRLDNLYEIACEVSKLTGFQFASNQPFVGPDTFTVETGIHHSLAQNIQNSTFDPKIIGRNTTSIVGRHSGIAGLREKLQEIGVNTSSINFHLLYAKVMEASQTEGTVSNDTLLQLVKEM